MTEEQPSEYVLERARRAVALTLPRRHEDAEDFAIRMHKAFEGEIYSITGATPREWADMSSKHQSSLLRLAKRKKRTVYGVSKRRTRVTFKKTRQRMG